MEARIRSTLIDLHDWADSADPEWRHPEDLAPALFAALSAQMPRTPAALLDSSDHAHSAQPTRSRRSILAFSAGPHATTVSHADGITTVAAAGQTQRREQGFFSWLQQNWPDQKEVEKVVAQGAEPGERDTPSFRLGWVGWLGHELKRESGSPVTGAGDRSALPTEEASLFRATHAVVLDHRLGQLELQWLATPEPEVSWVETVREALRAALAESSPQSPNPRAGLRDVEVTDLIVRDSHTEYLAAVEAAQREIVAGNSYEICLTTAVTARLGTAAPRCGIDLFRRLRSRNRAPFTQFLRIGETEILSTSPERFMSLSASGTVRSEPIKGTRPRGTTAAEDQRLAEDLVTHPKDRAENVMIADLVRNDLSIHAAPGTLRTERLCAVETYPTVHQLVSTISAQIPSGAVRARVIADAFPPGSMTGAPKISTMNILEELESGPRGPYSGVAGYFSADGAADLAVLIRTVVLTGPDHARRLHLGLGGAITADSEPEAEWEEVRVKSRGVLEALGAEFPRS
ncbi:anthranilate synthase component I family protein [Nesterenkonia lutea]|uniref:Anthranilate synthase component 1/para-aminobenzoate synthetase n=1 Tax=Nesterenkonia lutea TaxID=272919 RepID=A0ABR9JG07_9MICC|nr:anthranilate synthase component I family protein [Nesterenkonia lutea]MBE1524854.1 anthranilate synthase component 1/para-aminobenzoate synthetase [Nesterenkonia lutea]